jgi:steroid 5-alpha reductase family enzyme
VCGFWQIRRKKHKHTHLEFFGNLVCSHSYVAVTIMETVVNSSNAALMRRIVQLENGMLPLFYHYPQIRMQFRVYEKSL